MASGEWGVASGEWGVGCGERPRGWSRERRAKGARRAKGDRPRPAEVADEDVGEDDGAEGEVGGDVPGVDGAVCADGQGAQEV